MTVQCGFCKGTGIEPGFTECVWCESTGIYGVIRPEALKKALAPRFTKGDTDPVGDCDKFEAGIHVGDWFQRIAVYGDSPTDAESLRDEILSALVSNPALREELADRKAKHLRSCQIAIGKSQLAKQRHAEVNALQQRLTAADERNDALEQRNAELVAQSQLLKRLLGDAKANLNPTGRLAKSIGAALNKNSDGEIPDFSPGNGNKARRRAQAIAALALENQRIAPCNPDANEPPCSACFVRGCNGECMENL